MQPQRIDLNLLEYLDVLLHERNVTRAANRLGITQPAMSNGLRRLRDMFEDPLLVRTADGMTPTERALELQPVVRDILANIDKAIQPKSEFDAATSWPATTLNQPSSRYSSESCETRRPGFRWTS